MRVSLKAHSLHEIVRWHDAHNCMTPVNDNDNRCMDASLIARLIRRKVEDNVDYTVASAQKDVKTLLKVDVPYKRAWHGRRKSHRSSLWYIAVLKFTNPETVVAWEWKEGQEAQVNCQCVNVGIFEDEMGRALHENSVVQRFEQQARTLILHFISSFMFPNKTQNTVNQQFLAQVWAYERIERIAPQRKGVDYLIDETAPLAQRWKCKYTYGDAPRNSTPPFRDQLTSLCVEEFRWQPYAKVLRRLPDFCKQGQAIWMTRCWMFCWAIREPHESGRVVRQFGYIQNDPKRPMITDNAAFLLNHAHSMSGYHSNNWVDHHSAGEVLNNIRVSSEKFREKREDENLLDEELDKHLGDIINQIHASLTLGANDEMDVEDTKILVDEDPSLPSQPPPGKKAKPWSRDKIGGKKRKVPIFPRTSQQQTEGQQNEDQAHSSRSSRIKIETQLENIGGPETEFDLGGPETEFDLGGPETQFGGQSQPQPGIKFLTMGESQS
ncbi:OLC1v1018557C1 [Oldenlandia corymbosa var. corymbosa]|uniref:OLC1v1018557C1 n=1 Tax=Oldenlandia corymbosa var. corymbosa TaxID=529605 RepID=A0AAV1EC02_OLDCO|nr:OLC1v1018557C1 [Oldenlandia corymbosa var. corymbosa]